MFRSYTNPPYPLREGYRWCVLTTKDLENKPKMEKKLLLAGFDLSGEVDIREVKKNRIWQYEQEI